MHDPTAVHYVNIMRIGYTENNQDANSNFVAASDAQCASGIKPLIYTAITTCGSTSLTDGGSYPLEYCKAYAVYKHPDPNNDKTGWRINLEMTTPNGTITQDNSYLNKGLGFAFVQVTLRCPNPNSERHNV